MPHNVLQDATAQLWATAFSYFRKATIGEAGEEWTTTDDPLCTITGSDDERIAFLLKTKSMAARFGVVGRLTFADLWNADADKLGAVYPPNPNSKSGLPYDGNSVDQALFNHLAFGFANNCDAIWRVAQRPDCLLQRQKWHDRLDNYIRPTLLKAIAIPKRWKSKRNAAVAERTAPAPPRPVVAVPVSFQTPQLVAAPVGEHVAPPPPLPGVPAPPATMPEAEGTTYIGASTMASLFAGHVYINDMHRIVSPDGFLMDSKKFDANPRFAKRVYQMKYDTSKPSESAWDAFVQSEVSPGLKVRGTLFDPRETPGAVLDRDGQSFVNTWQPVEIKMEAGDVTPFLTHLSMLFDDWQLLVNYLKFMVQRKGVKAMWWPFLQGVPGNGKSFISDTVEYCIGEKFTQRPTPKNLDSEFNYSLYGCLFLAIEDIKVAEDYGQMWETIKPMVTQTRLEIQPKGVDKVTREVCFNALLNSNHKDGIRKTVDDRRIAPMFAKQQRRGDLIRDGLTPEYFSKLWNWAKPSLGGKGWLHVAHYLANDPIDPSFDAMQCPWTTSTPEALRVGRTPAQQEVMNAVDSGVAGFRGGWLNMTKVGHLMDARRYRLSIAMRELMVEELGYIPHPGLVGGRVDSALTDGSQPVLYVLPTHTTLALNDPKQIKAMYEAANRN